MLYPKQIQILVYYAATISIVALDKAMVMIPADKDLNLTIQNKDIFAHIFWFK